MIGHTGTGKTDIASAGNSQTNVGVVIGPVVYVSRRCAAKVDINGCPTAYRDIVRLVGSWGWIDGDGKVLRCAYTKPYGGGNRNRSSCNCIYIGSNNTDVAVTRTRQSNRRIGIGPIKRWAARASKHHIYWIAAANRLVGRVIHRWGLVNGDGKGSRRTWTGTQLRCNRNGCYFLVGTVGAGKIEITRSGSAQTDARIVIGPVESGARRGTAKIDGHNCATASHDI